MILGKHHRENLLSADKTEEGEFRPGHIFLDHDLTMAELVVQEHVLEGGLGLFRGLGDHNTLSGGKAIILQDHRERTRVDIFKSLVKVLESLVGGRGDIIFLHQPLGEILAGLDGGSGLGRSEYGLAGLGERVDYPRRQGRLRADHRQVDAFLLDELQQLLNLGVLDRDTLGLGRDAGVARGAINLADMDRS